MVQGELDILNTHKLSTTTSPFTYELKEIKFYLSILKSQAMYGGSWILFNFETKQFGLNNVPQIAFSVSGIVFLN